MTIRSRTVLKGYFNAGDQPTEAHFDDLIDSAMNLADDEATGGTVTLDVNADTLLSLSTQELGFDTQTANRVLAGPTTGAAAVPTFRTITAASDVTDALLTTGAREGASGQAQVFKNALGAQLQLKYDNSNTTAFAVGSAGDLTITPTGKILRLPPENTLDLRGIQTPTAPVAAATGTAGNPNGTYQYVVTYKGTTYETAWSVDSNTVTPASVQVNVTLPVSADAATTQRKLYRTKTGVASVYYLLATINDNTTTLYVDNTADADLGAEIPHGLINSAFTTGQLYMNGVIVMRDSGHELTIGRSAGGTAAQESYDNVYIGENAGGGIERGAYMTIVGNQAAAILNNAGGFVQNDTIIGTKAGHVMTTGDFDTLLGADSGHGTYPLTTGHHDTFLGWRTGLGSATQRNYLTVIGADATGDYDNAIVLGRPEDDVYIAGSLQILDGNAPSATAKIFARNVTTANLAGNALAEFTHTISGASTAITATQIGMLGVINASISGGNAISHMQALKGELGVTNAGATVYYGQAMVASAIITAGSIYEMTGLQIMVNAYGGTVANAYGLKIDPVATSGNNYALYTGAGNVVFNADNDAGTDFTVKSDTYDALFVDASNNSIALMNHASGKVGFYAATPIVRPTTASGAATFTANSGTAVNDASTFDGYTLNQVVKALRDIGVLT